MRPYMTAGGAHCMRTAPPNETLLNNPTPPALQLTPQQDAALAAMREFLDSDDPCFILRGYAGTGKTTLVSRLLELLRERQQDYLLLASTGRAARILGMATGEGAQTVHSIIYEFASVEMSGDTGLNVRFSLSQEGPENTVIIIDEASMLANGSPLPVGQASLFTQYGSGQLLSDFLFWSGLTSGLLSGNRVIFVGDAAQLPPVGETVSMALFAPHIEKFFGLCAREVELTAIVRQQQGSHILEQASRLRDSIISGAPDPVDWLPPAEDWRYLAGDEEATRYRAGHMSGRASIIITHSNKRALELNRKVRRERFQSMFAPLQPGDILMVNQNNSESQLLNGDLVKVLEVGPQETRLVMVRLKQRPMPKQVTLLFRQVKVAYHSMLHGRMEQECLILENLLHSPLAGPTDEERQALVTDFKQRIRAEKLTPAQISGAFQNDPYLNALQVKYGYALTCHKAQGGEWETAIVDVPGYLQGSYTSQLRWLYTAITRGKREVRVLRGQNAKGWLKEAGGPK